LPLPDRASPFQSILKSFINQPSPFRINPLLQPHSFPLTIFPSLSNPWRAVQEKTPNTRKEVGRPFDSLLQSFSSMIGSFLKTRGNLVSEVQLHAEGKDDNYNKENDMVDENTIDDMIEEIYKVHDNFDEEENQYPDEVLEKVDAKIVESPKTDGFYDILNEVVNSHEEIYKVHDQDNKENDMVDENTIDDMIEEIYKAHDNLDEEESQYLDEVLEKVDAKIVESPKTDEFYKILNEVVNSHLERKNDEKLLILIDELLEGNVVTNEV